MSISGEIFEMRKSRGVLSEYAEKQKNRAK